MKLLIYLVTAALLSIGLCIAILMSLIIEPSEAFYHGKPTSYWREVATIRDGCCIRIPPGIPNWREAEREGDILFNGDPSGILVLKELLQDNDCKVCLRAAQGLGRLGQTQIVIDRLLKLLQTANNLELQIIAYQIKNADPKAATDRAVPILVQRLNEESVFTAAIFMLAQYGSLSYPAVPELVQRLGAEKVKSPKQLDTALALLQIDMEGTKGIALPIVVEEAIEVGHGSDTTDDYFLTAIARLESVANETLKELDQQAPEIANRLRAKIAEERKHSRDDEVRPWTKP